MSSNISNSSNYLRTSRNFPTEMQPLTVEINRAYVDIATQVNNRISGIFGTSTTITGESWFLDGQSGKQQTLRRVFQFGSAGNIDISELNFGTGFSNIAGITKIFGTFTDGVNWYPLPYVDVVSATNQVSVSVTATEIVITTGAGAPPSITKGTAILEWLSNV